MRPLTIATLGLVAGGLFAGAGLLLAPDDTVGSNTGSSTTTTPTDSVFWVDPHETHVGPAVLIPEALTVQDDVATLSFRLESLAPHGEGFVLEDVDPTGVAIETWVLVTTDGEYEGTTVSASARVARFPVDADFLIGKVTGLRITQYRTRVPYTYQIDLPPVAGASIALEEGYALTVDAVLAQASSVIVHLDATELSDVFAASRIPTVQVTGVGPHWISASTRQFASGFQLVREGPEVPDRLRLRVHSIDWIPVEETIEVDLGGVSLGG